MAHRPAKLTGRVRTYPVILAGVALLASPAYAASWYLDGLNGGRYNSGSQSSPFLYLWQAVQKAQPGDTIYVVPSMTYSQLGLTVTGTPTAPITLSGSDPANPTKVSGMGVNSGIWVNSTYVIVTGFDVTAPGSYPGISLPAGRHHITLMNNNVHDCGESGISTFSNDYLTISHNTIVGNAKNTSRGFFGSGVSILGSVDVDSVTSVKMVIDGNIFHDNTNIPNCSTPSCFASAQDSDGSGLILDDNQRQRFDNVPYKGAFLISNNVSYKNGGRGIHIYKSDNVTVTGNTAYFNNQDPYENDFHPGEILALNSGNVAVYDNLLESDGLNSPIHTGTAPNTHVIINFSNATDGTGPMIAQHNLGYNPQKNGSLFFYGQNNTNPIVVGSNLFSGPKLENPAAGDFRFKTGSPAYGSANVATSVAVDILGASRSPLPSMGAYQNPGP